MFESKNTLMFAGFALLIRSAAAVAIQRLPIVDLGYQLHQAASFNVSYKPPIGPGHSHTCICVGWYLFSNRTQEVIIISPIFDMPHLL